MSALLLALCLNELYWWAGRRRRRAAAYELALREARALGVPLVVVGAPDRGLTAGYGCGDLAVDLAPSACSPSLVADAARIPLPDSSCVVLVSCVLEYVDDLDAAVSEIRRVSGGRTHVVGVEPWTLAAWVYPGTRRVGAARALRREAEVGGLSFRSEPYAIPRGQGADWVAPLPGGRRAHLHQLPDGSWRGHVDRHDPDAGPASAALHLLLDVPAAALRRLAGDPEAVSRSADRRGSLLPRGAR